MIIVFASCEADLYRTGNVMVIVFASCEADLYRTGNVMVIVFASCEADLYRTGLHHRYGKDLPHVRRTR
jgi:hypothetical protein